MEVNETEEAESIKLTIQSNVEGAAKINFEKTENFWHPQGLKTSMIQILLMLKIRKMKGGIICLKAKPMKLKV